MSSARRLLRTGGTPGKQQPVEAGTLSTSQRWRRAGQVLGRNASSTWGSAVFGDPCVMWDDAASAWRMFLFALPPGHGQALCSGDPCDPAGWKFVGPLGFTNPEAIVGGAAFKPFVVLDPHSCGRAARIDGRYALLVVVDHEAKVVQRAWATELGGPWTLEDRILIARGTGNDFDARHVDAVSAYYFAERDEIVYFYMGYPRKAQPRALSSYGSAQGVATELVGNSLMKRGPVLAPCARRGHWASGWVGGLQLLRGSEHRWVGLVNASPTAPDPSDTSLWREEPPPSLGGFAFCDEQFPVTGWQWCDEPFERIEDVPAEARAQGEDVNLWRHHALVFAGGRVALFYNSGGYFNESLYLKTAE